MSLCHLVSGKLAFGVQDVGDGHGILIVAIASKATSYLTASYTAELHCFTACSTMR
jgi:hypothetical protein